MKALVGAFNQEKALVGVGAFSVIVQPVVEPMEHYKALLTTYTLFLSCIPGTIPPAETVPLSSQQQQAGQSGQSSRKLRREVKLPQ